jgi:glycosyltransferase involved in cell wall biosynthesis
VSVIIPVRDRRELLGRCLDALGAQSFRDFEVVVVDDGSTDGSGDVASAHAARVIRTEGVGAVQARVAGIAAATGDVLAFTDSDCEPVPQWLAEAVAAVDAGADLVNGRTRPARPTLPLERSMGSGLDGLYPTCNVVYRRRAYEAAGGFDADAGRRWGFRPDRRSRGDGFGEDTLLAWRVVRAGGEVRYVPEAEVVHAVFPPDAVDVLSRTVRVAAFPALVREVPELRRTLLRWRWQLGARTRLPLYVVVAATVVRRPRLAGTALVWWVGTRLVELRRFPIPWRRRFAVLPVELAIDVLTATSLAVGSIRARSVTL